MSVDAAAGPIQPLYLEKPDALGTRRGWIVGSSCGGCKRVGEAGLLITGMGKLHRWWLFLSVWRHSGWTSAWRWKRDAERSSAHMQNVQVLVCRQAHVALIACIHRAPISLHYFIE